MICFWVAYTTNNSLTCVATSLWMSSVSLTGEELGSAVPQHDLYSNPLPRRSFLFVSQFCGNMSVSELVARAARLKEEERQLKRKICAAQRSQERREQRSRQCGCTSALLREAVAVANLTTLDKGVLFLCVRGWVPSDWFSARLARTAIEGNKIFGAAFGRPTCTFRGTSPVFAPTTCPAV